jgi:hypothetical protein
MAGCVASDHPICIVNMPHMMVIIYHNCRLYHIPVFIATVAFSGWIVNICQEAHVCLVPPHHSCQVTSGRYSNVTMFQSMSRLWGPFLCSLTVPQQRIFSGPSHHTGQGRKGRCPCTVYDQNPPCQISHCSIGFYWFVMIYDWVWDLTFPMHLGLNSRALCAPYQFMGALLLC